MTYSTSREELRKCSKCFKKKLLKEFHKQTGRNGGYKTRCKICIAEDTRLYYSLDETIKRRHRRDERLTMNAKGVRQCKLCKQIKPLNQEHFKPTRQQKTAPSLQHTCRLCVRERINRRFKTLYQSEEYRSKFRANCRKYSSGFTPTLWAVALSLQNHMCAICETDLKTMRSTRVHADHDHITRSPRGVLCQKCNAGLGMFGDSIKNLRAAINYLQDPPLSLIA